MADFFNIFKSDRKQQEPQAAQLDENGRAKYTPKYITELADDEIFVFGSNLSGMHGGGAAALAYRRFGAVWGQGVGLQGQSYGIPTMQGGTETIKPYVDEFIAFAKSHPELRFLVTKIGCGIAGFSEEEIAPLFADAVGIANVVLPESFVAIIKSRQPVNIAVFASGSGSNCENLIRYFNEKECARVALVISNKSDAYVLERAKQLNVPSVVVPKAELQQPEVVMPLMEQYHIGFVVLAGFLPLVPNYLIDAFPRKMVNIHPSLLPKYGGKGMWGHHVHEAVKAAGETETGMTVHYVTPQCDEGDIIAQFRVALSPTDSADDIAAKEHVLEMEHFPKVIEQLILS